MLRGLVAVLCGLAVAVGVYAGGKAIPWTTSKVVGSPEPAPPYKLVNAFPSVKFNNPVLMVAEPGSDRLYVAEQGGDIYSFRPGQEAKKQLAFSPSKELKNLKLTPEADSVESTYGFVFHPKFVENRTCFVCYTVKHKTKPNLAEGTRLSRFRMTEGDTPRIDVASEEIVLTFLQGGHNGGDLHFGPDGMLYISTGDAASPNPPDELKTGQDITDLLSSILRIDVDKKDTGKNYAVPTDNPFISTMIDSQPARPEVWAYGFRNPWRMSFDRKTGDLWVGDVGWEVWEMIHKVEKGSNCGWSAVESRQAVNTSFKLGPTPIRPPIIEINHSDASSITGGYVYRGQKFPELVGKYIFGDWGSKRIWAADVQNGEVKSMPEITPQMIRVVAFGQDHAGELYLLDYDNGTIHTLAKNDTSSVDPAKFPRTLSATGLLADTKNHTPAAGVTKFEIASPQWQDFSHAEHFVALPGGESVRDYADKKQIPGNINWTYYRFHFPANAVLMKTITLDMEQGNPATRKRVETQLLHFDGQFWAGYTYAWRDDQTDADLVPADGAEKQYKVRDPVFANNTRTQTWNFASRSQCMQCHHFWAEHSLAFNIEQLNRNISTLEGPKNQLQSMCESGLLERRNKEEKVLPTFNTKDLKDTRRLANPHDKNEKLDDRAKSYLHANCGHCHRMGGGGAVDFELQAFADWNNKKVLGAKPVRGTFDLPDACIIKPGEPDSSTVFYRVAKFGSGRMPHIGSEFVDSFGTGLLRNWIASLGGKTVSETATMLPTLSAQDIDTMLATKPIDLARAIGTNTCGEQKAMILAAAAKLPAGPKRDLFEGYFASEGKEKKLGSNPRAKSILALKGDATRGKELYLATKSQCANCHKLDGQGKEIGPDLTTIGKTRTREHLLESLLEPSRRIEPQYQSYIVLTTSGQVFTALMVKKDAKEVVFKDAENKEIRLAVADMEKLSPARESLMPSGLLADFTAQQAADLLEFLSQKK
jgi:putative heme-binding domain-containing protein